MDVLDRPLSATSAANNDQLVSLLLQPLWGVESLNSIKDGRLYYQFYKSRIQAIDYRHFAPRNHNDILDLVAFLKSNRHETFATLLNDILSSNPRWEWVQSRTEQNGRNVINFGISLWLMVTPRQWTTHETLSEHIKTLFPTNPPHSPPSPSDSITYHARALYRVGGFDIVCTSRLEEHLRLDVRSAQLFVFRHATFLKNRVGTEEREVYPPHLLQETAGTLAILFPLTDAPRRRWDRRIREKADVDVEDGLACSVSREAEHFPVWGPRLREIQRAYDASRPRKVRQWVYDRRDGNQQATFWLAVAAIVLTLLFGLIQSVTGLIQVLG